MLQDAIRAADVVNRLYHLEIVGIVPNLGVSSLHGMGTLTCVCFLSCAAMCPTVPWSALLSIYTSAHLHIPLALFSSAGPCTCPWIPPLAPRSSHVPGRQIVALKGVGCEDESSVAAMRRSMYFVEEYMKGGSLEDMLLQQMERPR